jgi:hypothetical protein
MTSDYYTTPGEHMLPDIIFLVTALPLSFTLGAYSGAWCSRFPAHRERGFQRNVNTIPA